MTQAQHFGHFHQCVSQASQFHNRPIGHVQRLQGLMHGLLQFIANGLLIRAFAASVFPLCSFQSARGSLAPGPINTGMSDRFKKELVPVAQQIVVARMGQQPPETIVHQVLGIGRFAHQRPRVCQRSRRSGRDPGIKGIVVFSRHQETGLAKAPSERSNVSGAELLHTIFENRAKPVESERSQTLSPATTSVADGTCGL